MPTNARERLLDAAEELFYAEGVRAVGVDRLTVGAGVGLASFYRHFDSKDALVAEVMRRHGERWLRRLSTSVTARGSRPTDVFDVLAERFEAANYRGCLAINTTVEVLDRADPAFQAAIDHKDDLTCFLDQLLAEAGYQHHAELARQFVVLVDGAMAAALRSRSATPAHDAKRAAEALLSVSC